jgi:hypothetical protein
MNFAKPAMAEGSPALPVKFLDHVDMPNGHTEAQAAVAQAQADAKARAEAQAAAKAKAKMTIVCVKGKSIRKVTAVKPNCPAGFKRR